MVTVVEEKKETLNEIEPSIEDELRKFLTFFVGDECFAFDMDILQEIIWVPQTVKVPLTPPSFVGLTNLRGSILPLIDIRRIFNMENTEIDEDTRAIIINIGFTTGIIVDKVDRVIEVMPDRIEDGHTLKSQSENIKEYLKGVIKYSDKDLIQLINIEALIKNEFSDIVFGQEQGNIDEIDKKSIMQGEDKENEDIEEKKIVSFFIQSQEFGFEIEDVKEIIKFPEDEIHKVPNADSTLLGMINYRDRILPLIDLGELVGLRSNLDPEQSKILVMEADFHDKTEPIGLAIDKIHEIIEVGSNLYPVPELISSTHSCKEIKAICQLDQGKRIISIFSIEEIIKHPDVEEALSSTEDLRTKEDRKEVETEEDTSDQEVQLVTFMLEDQEFGIVIDHIQEIILIPEEINVVPNTPDYIEGMINLRGAVLPVIDLRKRLHKRPLENRNDFQRILVITTGDTKTGLIVDSVTGVLSVEESKIEDAPDIVESSGGFIKKLINIEDQGRIVLIFDVKKLLGDGEFSSQNDD
ncbi:chemotaxis protein CheW [Desulfothermus naphthae]